MNHEPSFDSLAAMIAAERQRNAEKPDAFSRAWPIIEAFRAYLIEETKRGTPMVEIETNVLSLIANMLASLALNYRRTHRSTVLGMMLASLRRKASAEIALAHGVSIDVPMRQAD